jgi:hypothetical protein
MSQHTPGPWQYDYSPNHSGINPSFLVMAGDHTVVAEVERDSERGVRGGIVEANARLIAAAPDLLSAAQLVRDCLYEQGLSTHACLGPLESAIAKAEGRA